MITLPEHEWQRILLLIAFASAFVQIAYYLLVFLRTGLFKPDSTAISPQPFSIVLTARNESDNLNRFLKDILEQLHPQYQVVVVNDCSWDQTAEVLERFSSAYDHLKVTTLIEQEKYRHGKKFALAIGIKGARYDRLVLTDADCQPSSPQWAALMASALEPPVEIVIGYGAYRKEKGWLNAWIRYDTAYNAMQYLSFALCGLPYMGTGRNLAYTRSLFFRHKGFSRHQHILSGDDDLFVNAAAHRHNTRVQLNPLAFTYSVAASSFVDWCRQKRRHMISAIYYRPLHQLLLGLFYASLMLFYYPLMILLLLKTEPLTIVSIYLLRMVVLLPVTALVFSRLKEKGLLKYTLLFDLFIAFLYPILAIINLVNKKHTWK
jgi:glycosyltransferase involved in cell wall biosynthesis